MFEIDGRDITLNPQRFLDELHKNRPFMILADQQFAITPGRVDAHRSVPDRHRCQVIAQSLHQLGLDAATPR